MPWTLYTEHHYFSKPYCTKISSFIVRYSKMSVNTEPLLKKHIKLIKISYEICDNINYNKYIKNN